MSYIYFYFFTITFVRTVHSQQASKNADSLQQLESQGRKNENVDNADNDEININRVS